jgi:hypothetical protein
MSSTQFAFKFIAQSAADCHELGISIGRYCRDPTEGFAVTEPSQFGMGCSPNSNLKSSTGSPPEVMSLNENLCHLGRAAGLESGHQFDAAEQI